MVLANLRQHRLHLHLQKVIILFSVLEIQRGVLAVCFFCREAIAQVGEAVPMTARPHKVLVPGLIEHVEPVQTTA